MLVLIERTCSSWLEDKNSLDSYQYMQLGRFFFLSICLMVLIPEGVVNAFADPFNTYQVQRQNNEQKKFQLQLLYGVQAYDKCNGFYSCERNLDFPPSFAMCLNSIESCLQRSIESKSSGIPSYSAPSCPLNATFNGKQCICDVSFSPKNGSCVSNFSLLDICPSIFGLTIGSDGNCVCKEGFIPDPPDPSLSTICRQKKVDCPAGLVTDSGQCITYDAGCQKNYGGHSIWSGKLETSGLYICDCANGYSWNVARTACVTTVSPDQPIPTEKPPIKQVKKLIPPVKENLMPATSSVETAEVVTVKEDRSQDEIATSSAIKYDTIPDQPVRSILGRIKGTWRGLVDGFKGFIGRMFSWGSYLKY